MCCQCVRLGGGIRLCSRLHRFVYQMGGVRCFTSCLRRLLLGRLLDEGLKDELVEVGLNQEGLYKALPFKLKAPGGADLIALF